MNNASEKTWPKHKSQIRINQEDEGNDDNSRLILSFKGEKKWKKVQHFY